MSDTEITVDSSSRLRRSSVVVPSDVDTKQLRGEPSSRWRRLLREINVEPVIFLFAITLGVMQSNSSLFVYWARCNQLFDRSGFHSNETDEVCAHLGDHSDYQNTVEHDITTTKIFLQIANGVTTLISAPLIGTWSDRFGGRKIPHLLSLASLAIYATIYMAAALTIKSVDVYVLMYTAETLQGILGGYPTLFSSALSMLADEARRKDDMKGSSISLKICISSALQFIGQLIGTFITSLCSASPSELASGHSSGYAIAFGSAAAICWCTLLYSTVFVRETHTIDMRRTSVQSEQSEPSGIVASVKKFRDFLVGLVAILLKKRVGWARFALNVTILFNVIEFLAMDNGLLLLLVKKRPFEWSDTTFSHYQLLKTCSISLGMLLAPIFLSRVHFLLGKDSILIMMGATSTAVSFAIDAFSKRTEYLFITGGLAFFTGGLTPGFRSFLPKLVEKDETARLYTLFSIVMTVWPIIATAVLNSIYNASLGYWPGLAFMVASAYDFFVLFGQLGLHLLMYPAWKRERQLEVHLQQE